ncbi:FRS2 [Bugula neritina]|uniref:FRS2 n=1 Tax=Bugula neritina TaxID=10212 RepID=A0A7J7JYZ7_BUGNE|nr:FRS2 [Bugula neritina]
MLITANNDLKVKLVQLPQIVSRVSLIPTVIQRIEMLDWLRKKIGCVSTHEEVIHLGITENNVNRFKVWADPSLTTMNNNFEMKSGILEVTDDELVHYQSNSEPIRWSYRCLRRYGMGSETFLFESGRRCTTGPGLFAFKCRHADMLHNVFKERLKSFAERPPSNVDGVRHCHHEVSLNSPPNRYSDDLMRSINPAANMIVEDYMTPTNQYINGGVANETLAYGQLMCPSNTYINTVNLAQQEYINTNGAVHVPPTSPQSGSMLSRGVSSSSSNGSRPPVREINYADLDLNQIHKRPNSHPMTGTTADMISCSDDEDDSAFYSPSAEASNNTKSLSLTDSSQECLRKTRHDSSADDLH